MPGIHSSQSAEQVLGEHPALRACMADLVERDWFRVVVAGKTPPPYNPEALGTQDTLRALSRFSDMEVDHVSLALGERDGEKQGMWRQVVDLTFTYARLIKARSKGPLDILVYPAPGASAKCLYRDILILPICLLLARKVVIHFHSEGTERTLSQASLASRCVARRLYRSCSAIAVTHHGKQEPQNLRMRDPVVVYNSVRDRLNMDELRLRAPTEAPSLLYAGQFSAEAGVPALLQAFSRVLEHHIHARLKLVGEPIPPHMQDELERNLSELGIEERVDLLGALQGRERSAAFASANLFVYPSVSPSESCSREVLEAMCWRLPVVTTRWKALPEITSMHAWYADPREGLVDSLTSAILSALSARESWARKGHLCRLCFEENFTQDRYVVALHHAVLKVASQ